MFLYLEVEQLYKQVGLIYLEQIFILIKTNLLVLSTLFLRQT